MLPLLAGLALAQSADFPLESYTLPNGMEVILHPDRKAPVVRVSFRFRVGSKHEPPGRTGLAHLFEHLLFQRRNGETDFATEAQRIGAADQNGETAEDYTEYYETVPAGRLERILWMESNRFAQLLDNLSPERLENQRAVVMNEGRQKIENEPYGRVDRLIHENALPSGHPYQHDAQGSFADLRAATLEDARAFYAEHYTPEQLTLVIAGDFDTPQAKAWVKQYFASMAPGPGAAGALRSIPALDAPRSLELEDRVRETHAYFVWPAPAQGSRDAAALDALAVLLNTGDRSLHSVLTDQISLGVSASLSGWQDSSLFRIRVTLVPGASMVEADAKVLAEMQRIAREGPTTEEMDRARNNLEFDQAGNLEDLSGVTRALQDARLYLGSVGRWKEWMGRYTVVTADEVKAAAGRWLTTPNHLSLLVRPQTAQRDETPPPDRTKPPAFAADKLFQAPSVQRAKLPNGLEILVMERHDVPKVAVEVRLKVGSMHAPPEKPAIASLAATVAIRATTTRDRNTIDREMERLAMTGHADAGTDRMAVGFQALRSQLNPAFRLFADVVRNATYPEEAVEAQKKDWLEALEKPDASLDDYERYALQVAYGAEHPLSATSLSSAASVRSVTAAEVRAFRDRHWKPNLAALSFAGDITLKEAVGLATESFGSWTGTAEVSFAMPPAKRMEGRLFLIDRKGATQTMVAQVAPGIGRNAPDEAALTLASIVLGGGSGSRLNRKIRQQDGIAYFAISQVSQYRGSGLWFTYSKVQTDGTGKAIRELAAELRDLGGAKPITAAELDQAKELLVRNLPFTFAGIWPSAETFARLWSEETPLDIYQTFPEQAQAVTLSKVNEIARKYALADQTFFILIGDREKIEPQLRELGLGSAVALQ
jgi:zinc protease